MLILSHKIVTTAVYQYHDVKYVPRTKELRNSGRNLVENNRLYFGNYRTANQRLLQGTTKSTSSIQVPVASLLAAILGLINYCYARKNSKSDHQGSDPSMKDHSESTIGSALMGSNSHENHNPHFTKSETDIWRSLIANEFDGEGDQVGKKRMKLERWMYQKCNCCMDEIEQKRKVDRYIQEMKALKRQKKLANVNRDKESTEHNNPNKMLPSNGVSSNNSPYSSGTRRSDRLETCRTKQINITACVLF
ncbi:uncharacterized protein CEXT_726121 [Caerostris extrusa]|uniref:Uncharacterized protein n=1 Tax=Caerostris extrusa TaxID=172846 RepID=A0AAV4NUG1_CAEEX|nr:uncharacterized protein CEXT_726121 [Caerostris extrusa]